ncbi:MAG TPA: hypothetical protein VKA53_10010, partial [Thermoanaerobaculia bacterium]|nr:hypothetical protein [Thermoanaerobaculia bacterium]
MADLVRIAAQWRERYRHWSSVRHQPLDGSSGDRMTGAGSQATALVESLVSDAWTVGGSWPATDSIARLAALLESGDDNLFGRTPSRLDGEGPRGSLTAAMGASLAGLRTVVFLSGPDLTASIDLLREAARRRLPLVVQLTERAGGGRSSLEGTSHDSIHLAADSGALLFHAVDVQEVADLSLLARRVAELALLPVVVAMDGAETASSVQDFRLPSPDAIRKYLGDPNDVIDTPAASQERLFGARRARIPRWHDAERPLLVAPGQGEEIPALAAASRHLMSDRDAGEALVAASAELSEITGRDVSPLRLHGTRGAKELLIAQGAAVELLEATSDKLATDGDKAPGIVGVRVLRPFPAAELVETLAGCRVAGVLERSDAPAWADPPLLRSIRSVIAGASEPGVGGERKTATSGLAPKEIPRLISVLLGAGGSPLRANDVAALSRQLSELAESPIYLGMSFSPASGSYPKQAAEWGAVSRAYPGLAS